MFNDSRTLRSHLATRRSGKARDMIAPGPDAATLRDMLHLAMRTPDHGKLAPWRFIIVGDDQRTALADLLKSAWIAENPGAADQNLSALDQFAHQAPTLVLLVSTPVAGSKIPKWEQRLSAGAVAMNLIHAAHAHGFVANWLTGWAAYSAHVTAAFGLGEGDRITGYFFFGSPARDLEERPRPDADAVISHWTPPSAD
ncbi:MAG: nitroreductase [Sphingopyxis sp.]|nr:nitroreductase [Sphingopyxis sp.]